MYCSFLLQLEVFLVSLFVYKGDDDFPWLSGEMRCIFVAYIKRFWN